MAAHPKHNYATLSTPGTKKISVCARRVGSRDRMSVIAVCTSETDAEKIVDGLNTLQGEITRLEAPAQRTLADVRASLEAERATSRALQGEVRELEHKLNDKSNEIGRLNLALSAAQKVARETA